jgi:hypothetical protein
MKGPAGEPRTVVGTRRQRIAAEDGSLVEQPRDVLARDAPVHSDAHAFMAEVVGHRQALDSPAGTQAVADEIHTPHLIDAAGQLQRHALGRRALDLLALAHGQVGRAVQAVDLLVVHAGVLRAQQVVDAPIAEAPTRVRDLHDAGLQSLAHLVDLRWIAIILAGEPHKPARTSFGQIALVDHHGDGCALGLRG